MTPERCARILIEGPTVNPSPGLSNSQSKTHNRRISVFVNRLLLRIFSVPALRAYLADIGAQVGEDGKTVVQLDFYRLPSEVIPQVIRLCAAPRPPKVFHYVKNAAARTGIELQIQPDDFKGDDYAYAF